MTRSIKIHCCPVKLIVKTFKRCNEEGRSHFYHPFGVSLLDELSRGSVLCTSPPAYVLSYLQHF